MSVNLVLNNGNKSQNRMSLGSEFHHYNKKLENTMPVEVFLHLGFRTNCKAYDNISLVLFKGFFSAFDIHMKLIYG